MTNDNIPPGWTKERFLADASAQLVMRAHLQWQKTRTTQDYTAVSKAMFVQGNDHLWELFQHVPQDWLDALKAQESQGVTQ
jgi:hypothetical protein